MTANYGKNRQDEPEKSRGHETVRAFIAIELDHAVLRALDKLQAELKRDSSQKAVRWVESSGIHLTLKFLGDVPIGQLEDLNAGLQRACYGFAPFAISCAGLGCFPNPNRPRVIWVGVDEPRGVLAELQQAVEREIAPLGYPTEDRPFSPHLTLGRVRREASRDDVRRLGQLIAARQVGKLAQMEARAVSLIRSELRPTGAVYTRLFDVSLRG